ncbi:alpha beta-hydrolase [Fusarium heterosporum]|uniref:Alpha beta-hydrolase n=1 Tax=Fusarium heterosporum TaxID=42747 RepID=A0A8H5X121_FUSHE|nr:alpha beta-hydrolase [Fusarium heterosporum]
MSTIKPYQINIPDHKIKRLTQKLALADFRDQDDPEEGSWIRGPPVAEIRRLAEVWQITYDWRDVEARLNQLPHFMMSTNSITLGKVDLHFIHKRSIQPDAIPLLFLHGWPGSFYEVSKVLDPLRGFGLEHHAEVYDKLMRELGYHRYVIQAADVGGIISRYMVKMFGPSRCLAHHTNTPLPTKPTEDAHPEIHSQSLSTPLTDGEQRGLTRTAAFEKEGSGYYKVQSTKPITIGYSLRDSPVGLLAWIYEKLHDWSDGYQWTDEEVLTWVSIYYFSTPGPDASNKVYYTFDHCDPPAFAAAGDYVNVPLGISRFSNDLVLLPKIWNHTLGPIVYEAEHEKGGHFTAWEQPDAIVGDLRSMFGESGVGPMVQKSLQDVSN